MIFKCKNCGGNVIYSPEKHQMLCPYCESVESGEREGRCEGNLKICTNCGGEVPVEKHTSATRCPYCDNYLILDERVEGAYEPKRIIPFQMGREVCKQAIRSQFKRFLFAPADFLSEAGLEHIQGTYVPFWFYDYDAHCELMGEGIKERSWTTGDMRYTETSFYDVYRDMDIQFRGIPVDASVGMPDDVMDNMEPYSYGQMKDFKPEYMSGFYAEKYNMEAKTVELRAKSRMEESAKTLLSQTCSEYGSMSIRSSRIETTDSKTQFGLLPVWKYVYRYKNTDFPFYVNGQTGKIVGTPPLSKAKMYCYSGTIWACLTVILLLLRYLL